MNEINFTGVKLPHAEEAVAFIEQSGEFLVFPVDRIEDLLHAVGTAKAAVKSVQQVATGRAQKTATAAVQAINDLREELRECLAVARMRRRAWVAGEAAGDTDGDQDDPADVATDASAHAEGSQWASASGPAPRPSVPRL